MASLEIRASSKWFYGRFKHEGKSRCKNLGVAIAGQRPISIREEGDREFERSRGRAQSALEELVTKLQQPQEKAALVRAIYEAQTGHPFTPIPLADLASHWETMPRRRQPTAKYSQECLAALAKFVAFVTRAYPDVHNAHQVSHQVATDYLDSLRDSGLGTKAWNDRLKLLRSTFRHLPDLPMNPFMLILEREVETVFREPFSLEEVSAIVEAAKCEPIVNPVIITALCTAMRKGDCATLKWSAVDLADGFITVKTSKTGETVDIPMLPMLEEEVRKRQGNDSQFVYPQAAQMYADNPQGLTYRLRKVLRRVGFGDAVRAVVPDFSMAEVEAARVAGIAALEELPQVSKTERMRVAFDLYMGGSTIDDVAAELGRSKSTISLYLNQLEAAMAVPFIRGKARSALPVVTTLSPRPIRKVRERGLRRASLRDFHSFRTTWITLALSNGVPMEIVRRVTGHKTVDIVLKHYFRPQRDEMRKVLQTSMPSLLTAGMGSKPEQATDLLRRALEERGEAGWQLVQKAVDLMAVKI
jgi:integrase